MKKISLTNGPVLILMLYLLLFFLLGIDGLPITHLPITFSFIVIVSLLVFLYMYFLNIQTSQLLVLFPFILFNFLYVVRFTGEPLKILYQIFYVVLLYILMNIEWKKKQLKLVSVLVIPMIFFCLYLAINYQNEYILVTNIPFYNGNPNPNTVGAYGFLLSYFPAIYLTHRSRKIKIMGYSFFTLITVCILWFSSARALLVAFMVTFGVIVIWNFIIKNRTIYNLFFAIILVICFSFIVIYPNLDSILPNFNSWDSLMIRFTGKRLLSGRNTLWKFALQLISEKPFWGHGSGAKLSDYFSSQLEAHNLYINIAFQVGIIGILTFVVGLWMLWNQFWENYKSPRVKISAGYFVGIIIYQMFEITILQSGFERGVLPWIIFGMGLSFSKINEPDNDKYTL
ncbi:hypothetical protein GIY09_01760 [Aerococcaceae bacterium WS4759]|uniref:O-antigen ligase-related domain-containing protein n=1 Tax=Fundicoccus ignavus TaxID=2664442 RepID=A0A6I2GFP9_9LACT|nr:O-antigen ligase family protein [Fundicoccus ignavus]MRI84622.1 hypothetical protein [Fundicoccus ignavus]